MKKPKRWKPYPTFVLIYRDPCTDACTFLEVGHSAADFIQSATTELKTYDCLIGDVIAQTKNDGEQNRSELIQLISQLHELKVFVGWRSAFSIEGSL